MKRDFTARPLKVFASYYKPHWRLFVLDMACATLVSATDLAFPFFTRMGLERYLPEGLYRTFFLVMAALAAAYVIRGILQYVITYWGHLLGVRIEADMRADIFGHIQSQSFHFFDHNRTGQLMSRITTDLFDITELAHHGPEDLFMSVLTLGGRLWDPADHPLGAGPDPLCGGAPLSAVRCAPAEADAPGQRRREAAHGGHQRPGGGEHLRGPDGQGFHQ